MTDEWTTEWPTVPGWYWTWRPSDDPEVKSTLQPGHVFLAGPKDRRFLCYVCMGGFVFPTQDRTMHWGPRIEIPEAPDETPGTRFAVALLCDQTHTYLTESCRETTSHAKAEIFADRRTAADALDAYTTRTGVARGDGWIEAIDDLDEFRSREDTW